MASTSSPWSAMALLATLSTASWLRKSIRERREGRDPVALESAMEVRAFLEKALPELGNIWYQLLAYTVRPEKDEVAPEVRVFEWLMHVVRARRLLHRVHQRLLSLYPAISEDLLERVRMLELEAERLLEGSGSEHEEALVRFAEEGLRCLRDIEDQLAGSKLPGDSGV